MKIIDIVKNFNIDGEFVAYKPFGDGHINDTFALTFKTKSGLKRYILQKINDTVFKDIDLLMANITEVTNYLRNVIKQRGGDVERQCLNMIDTVGGQKYYTVPKENTKWRAMQLIENTEAYQIAVDPYVFEMTGKAFGEFIRNLDGFPVEKLGEVLPNFHNTKKRFENFLSILKDNPEKRRRYCRREVKFALRCQPYVSKIVDMLASGEMPTRVTHNDTKINNLLIDSNTGDAVCVIDLDTIMPGSIVYDFGDAIRSGCNTAMEDEKNLELVTFNMEMFDYFSKGFIAGVGEVLTQVEKDNLAYGAILITFECGVRFLTDYLNGDKYFKTCYSNHNLIRCRTQFKLVQEMEQRLAEMNAIVDRY